MSATVSYRYEFEAAYVQNQQLNAHRYRIEVTVDGPQRYADHQQIIDYRTLAEYVRSVCPRDQFLVGSDSSTSEIELAECMRKCGVSVSSRPHPLTIESFCESVATELQDVLNRHEPGVRVIEVKLRETNDSFATWML